MATFVDALRGDGLIRVQNALAVIEEDFQHAGHITSRFDDPPPTYTTYSSGMTTPSQSPNPPTQEEQNRIELRDKLREARRCSEPYRQFQQQAIEEANRIWEADSNRTRRLRVGEVPSAMADDNIKKRWVEQGIWNDRWASKRSIGLWKHQEPLEIESDYETDPEAPPRPLFSSQPKAKRLKSEEARQKIAERRVIREREREASRPYHQFIYQMSRERERLHKESGEADKFAENINTKAYEAIKNIWLQRNIWVDEWGIIPGMSWIHEKSWDEAIAERGLMSPVTEPKPLSPSSQARQPPPFDNSSPFRPFSFTNVDATSSQARNDQTVTMANPPNNGLLINEDTNRNIDRKGSTSLPTPKSPQTQGDRPTKGKARSRAGKKQATSIGLSPQNVANTSLSPMHSSKVAKPSLKKRLRTMQSTVTPKKASEVNPTPAPDTQPRRSPRLRRTVPDRQNGVESGSDSAPQKKSSVKTTRSKSAVKPQGVTKQQRAKTSTKKAKPPGSRKATRRRAK